MQKLTIVANIIVKESHTEQVKAELFKLIDITRTENGCINYDLHQDNENPSHFMVYENWDSHESWQAHANNEHLAAFLNATEGAIESFVANKMSHIG